MTRSLLPNLLADPEWTIVAAADLDGETRGAFERRFPGVAVLPSGEALIESPELKLDAVFIAVDPVGHVELARKAAEKGLNVFVEKPCGTASQQVLSLIRSTEWTGALIMVGTMWRYTKAAQLLLRFSAERGTGRTLDTLDIHACYPALLHRKNWTADPLRLAFLDMFVHPIDFAAWHLPPPYDIRAVTARPFEDGKGSVFVVITSRATGRVATLHLLCGSLSYSVRMTANFSDGSLAEIHDLNDLLIVTAPTWTGTEGGLRDRAYLGWNHGPLYRGYARHGYAEEIEAFGLAINRGAPLLSTLQDAFATMRLIEGAIASLESQTVISVDTDIGPAIRPSVMSADADVMRRVEECVAKTIGIEVAELGHNPEFGVIPLWDSVAHMNLMVALELAFGVNIPDDAVPQLTSAQAIAEFLRSAQRVRQGFVQ